MLFVLVQSFDLSGCGKTKGCSRAPAGCPSSEECYYVFTQQADNAGQTVTFELSGMVGGWVAAGYNFNYTMVT